MKRKTKMRPAGMSARQAKPTGSGFHSPNKYTKNDRHGWKKEER